MKKVIAIFCLLSISSTGFGQNNSCFQKVRQTQSSYSASELCDQVNNNCFEAFLRSNHDVSLSAMECKTVSGTCFLSYLKSDASASMAAYACKNVYDECFKEQLKSGQSQAMAAFGCQK